MYQSGRAGDKAKKHKSPAKRGRVGITADLGSNSDWLKICLNRSETQPKSG